MFRRISGVLFLVIVAACDGPNGPSQQPAERFGAISALIDGRPWISSYGPDSLVAAYDTVSGQLQILGYEFRLGVDPHLDLFIRVQAGLGAYHLGDFLAPAFAQWNTVLASRRSRVATERLELLVSTGASEDSLMIDELSIGSRLIRGRFNFTATAMNGTLSTRLTGRFAGRVELYNGTNGLLRR